MQVVRRPLCEFSHKEVLSGERGSNTCLTHPALRDNSGKLELIPDGTIRSQDLMVKA